jgi:hypothetical protein
MIREQRERRIAEIEEKYKDRRFLELSLCSDAMEWRRLTAPNASSFDDEPKPAASSKGGEG